MSQRNSKKCLKKNFEAISYRTFNKFTTKDSYTRNITRNAESTVGWNLKPERWGSPSFQEKYQGAKVCEQEQKKKYLYSGALCGKILTHLIDISPNSVQPEISIPCSQQLSNCLSPESDKSSRSPSFYFYTSVLKLTLHLRRGVSSDLFLFILSTSVLFPLFFCRLYAAYPAIIYAFINHSNNTSREFLKLLTLHLLPPSFFYTYVY